MEYTWSSLLWDIAAIWFLVALGLTLVGLCQGWRWIAQLRHGIASLGDDYTLIVTGPFRPIAEGCPEVRLRFWHDPVIWFVLPTVSLAMFFLFALLSIPPAAFRIQSADDLLAAIFLLSGMAGLCYLGYNAAKPFPYRATSKGILFRYGIVGTCFVPWPDVVEARIHGSPPLAVTIVAKLPNGKRIERWLLNGFRDPSKFEPLIIHLLGRRTRDAESDAIINKEGESCSPPTAPTPPR